MAAAPQQAEVKSPQRSQAEAEAPAPAKSKPVGVYKVLIDFSTPIGSQLVQFKSGYLILDPAMGAALQASGCPVAIDDKAKRVICPQCGHVHAFRLE